MRLLIIVITLQSLLIADFIELYRVGGIEAVKNRFDNIIQTKDYWNKKLQNSDVRYGYYETINSLLVCNKSKKEIILYKKKNNLFKEDFSSSVFIGKANGDKQREGDLKTPVGVYKLTKRLTKLDPFYGPLALVTSYPNLYDKMQNKTGSGIWIHGLPVDEKRDEFTRGCVALDNAQLKVLNSKFNYKKSLILVGENDIKHSTKEEISSILSQIYKWKNAWQKSDLENYLSFYSKDFKKDKGIDFKKFKIRKARIFKRSRDKTIKFSNINISPYPNSKKMNLFKVVMDEDYRAKFHKFIGKKELYLELKDDGKISILTES